MPTAEALQLSSSINLSAIDKATVYWFGKLTGGTNDQLIWGHGFNQLNGIWCFQYGDQLRLKMFGSTSEPTEIIYTDFSAYYGEYVCITAVFDLTQVGTDQITGYINGDSSGWSPNDDFGNDAFGDFTPQIGDNGELGSSRERCLAFAMFPEAHTPAQIQAVSDAWFAASGVNE